ncbi:MAG: hypothetical protein RMJ07_05815 [Nitrososphaerota archaeon]|nr:hypothetical protein [Candidatus Bathyarchaeota archaeon]MDW8049176.1 hypothetical protein [Nitrososphaerota archaeon]
MNDIHGCVKRFEVDRAIIDAKGMHYFELNALLRELSADGIRDVEVYNVYGQRYIGTGLKTPLNIRIYGVPGNDLGAFMDGQRIFVYGNAQDGCGNTMNDGLIIVHGDSGDVAGYGMRGGKIFVKGDAGFRVGVHMKEYGGKRPTIIIGGNVGDFLGEYMSGGIILVLNLSRKEGGGKRSMKFVGVGMHGGTIYIRGEVVHVAKEARVVETDEHDLRLISELVRDFSTCFSLGMSIDEIMSNEFVKVVPASSRPYGKLYG